MDWMMIVIFLGFMATGAIAASPIAFALGQRHILRQLDYDYEDVLEEEILEVSTNEKN